VQAVFQDPYASLNPRMRVSAIIAEPLTTNESLTAGEARRHVLRLLDLVGLPKPLADLFPHEFSGGQRPAHRHRAGPWRLSPKLVVLDEPVSALDVSIRAQILNLLRDLQAQLGLSYLFIATTRGRRPHEPSHRGHVHGARSSRAAKPKRSPARRSIPIRRPSSQAALPSHPRIDVRRLSCPAKCRAAAAAAGLSFSPALSPRDCALRGAGTGAR